MNGKVYRLDVLRTGMFYIGATCKEGEALDNYFGSSNYLSQHLIDNNIERNNDNIKRTILIEGIESVEELKLAEEAEIKKYLYEENNRLYLLDNRCLNRSVSGYRCIRPGQFPCEECGSIHGHKSSCSKSNEKGRCSECGYLLKSHKHSKACSRYKEEKKHVEACPECGVYKGSHKKTCSRYISPEPCPECGITRGHLKTCSRYNNKAFCEECKSHHGNHKKWCSHYNQPECSECGGLHGHHYDFCSKAKGRCPECNYSLKSNLHSPNCSHFTDNSCEYCGSRSRHKIWCVNNKTEKSLEVKFVCIECKGINGSHNKSCRYRDVKSI